MCAELAHPQGVHGGLHHGTEGDASGEGGDGGVNRVQRFPVAAHHGVVELLAPLHEVFVPLLHVTLGDGFCKTPPSCQKQ